MIRPAILLIVGLAIPLVVLATSLEKSNLFGDSITPRIIGGKYAVIGQFPFMVSLQTYSTQWTWLCSGAILHEYWIATAAHCVFGKSLTKMFAFVGSIEKCCGTKYTIKQAFYNATAPPNDLALLKTTSKIVFTKNVRPIVLSNRKAEIGMQVRISGFGYSDINNTEKNTKLKFLDMVIVASDPNDLVYIKAVSKNGTSPCSGDSGSPVTYLGKLIGIHSRSSLCKSPSKFVNIPYFVSWIKEKINTSVN